MFPSTSSNLSEKPEINSEVVRQRLRSRKEERAHRPILNLANGRSRHLSAVLAFEACTEISTVGSRKERWKGEGRWKERPSDTLVGTARLERAKVIKERTVVRRRAAFK